MLACSALGTAEEEELAGGIAALEAEEETKGEADAEEEEGADGDEEEEDRGAEVDWSIGDVAEMLLLLVGGVIATAELERSVAISRSCRRPCQCSWNRVMRRSEMSNSSPVVPPPESTQFAW